MERGRWEGQNIQPLKEVQRLEEEEEGITHKSHVRHVWRPAWLYKYTTVSQMAYRKEQSGKFLSS